MTKTLHTIEGKWTGYLKYDKGFPLQFQARYVAFTMNISCKDGVISGIWVDEHTEHFNLEPSTFTGTFDGVAINFEKTRPLSPSLEHIKIKIKDISPALYSGQLRKKLFSSAYYFKGKCSNTLKFTNKMGKDVTRELYGLWKMKRE